MTLTAGAGQRLTVVVGSAGSGKSVLLLQPWAAARPPRHGRAALRPGRANPARFWTGFVESPRAIERGFGADAADLLATDGAMSADVTASIADAARSAGGSAVIVDDIHPGVRGLRDMADWSSGGLPTAQLVLASRTDPQLRLHPPDGGGAQPRPRPVLLAGREPCPATPTSTRRVGAGELALLHQTRRVGRRLADGGAVAARRPGPGAGRAGADVRGHAIAEYFISEVLQTQPPEVTQFLLETSVLGELTAEACAVVTGLAGRGRVAARRRRGQLVPCRSMTSGPASATTIWCAGARRAAGREQDHEQAVQLRAGEWFESAGTRWRAALAAQQPDRALVLLQDRVVPDFLRNPALPGPPN